MKGFIYKITDKVTGKSYIGQTRKSVEFRWRQHKNSKDYRDLHKAIQKYGEENFSVETLKECDVDELDKWEIYYISKYNTFENGYNMTKGGSTYNPVKRYNNGYIVVDNKYDEIIAMYKAGFSATKIANCYEVDRHVICNILRQLGYTYKKNRIRFNSDELKEVIEKYYTGHSLKSLAKEYGCSAVGLKEYLMKKGVDLREKYSILKDEERQKSLISKYLNREKSLKELMKEYQCSYNVFKRILNKHGIAPIGKGATYKLTDKENLEVIKRFNDGMKIIDIAKEYKVDKCTIYSILNRYHVNY